MSSIEGWTCNAETAGNLNIRKFSVSYTFDTFYLCTPEATLNLFLLCYPLAHNSCGTVLRSSV
jgi:hypothetical protein